MFITGLRQLLPVGSSAGKVRGFGFAGFMCRAHAEKAIKLANGKVPFHCWSSSLSRCLECLYVA